MHAHGRAKRDSLLGKLVWLAVGAMLGAFVPLSWQSLEHTTHKPCPAAPRQQPLPTFVPGPQASPIVAKSAADARDGGSKEQPYADFGCATIKNSKWERELCFSAINTTQSGNYIHATLDLRALKRDASGGTWAAACGDSYDIRFESSRSFFAPDIDEVECGLHRLRFIVPPDAKAYEAAVWLIHVDGQGMRDPPEPRQSPAQLSSWNDGPAYYNIRPEFAGRLHVPEWYIQDPTDAQGIIPGTAEFASAREPKKVGLPLCASEDAPGRWVYTHHHYAENFGEPLVWRPYGCHHRHYSGLVLNQCVKRLGKIKFVGESTMGQLLDVWQSHLNMSTYYWPQFEPISESNIYHNNPDQIRGRDHWGTYHGMFHVEESAISEMQKWSPDVIVFLQGANDASRDKLEMFEVRLRRWLGHLTGNITAGLIAKPKKFIYVTSPTRVYKWGGHPGRAVCPESSDGHPCWHVPGRQFDMVNGEVVWRREEWSAPVHQFFGTWERRRWISKKARVIIKEFFPDMKVVDYEGITAPLPADYSIDGEHFYCRYDLWKDRVSYPYPCKGLANSVAANLIANAACNDLGVQ